MDLRGEVTLIVIAHRLSTVQEADTLYVLKQGEVAQQGNHQALLAQEGLYRQMHSLQQKKTALNG